MIQEETDLDVLKQWGKMALKVKRWNSLRKMSAIYGTVNQTYVEKIKGIVLQ